MLPPIRPSAAAAAGGGDGWLIRTLMLETTSCIGNNDTPCCCFILDVGWNDGERSFVSFQFQVSFCRFFIFFTKMSRPWKEICETMTQAGRADKIRG
jgi:hypothetical protein